MLPNSLVVDESYHSTNITGHHRQSDFQVLSRSASYSRDIRSPSAPFPSAYSDMHRALNGVATALDLAGNLSGVPYVGIAAVIVKEIADTCNNVVVHKQKCKRMAAKCTRFIVALEEQARIHSTLEKDSGATQSIDEALAHLATVLKRTRDWAGYSRVKGWLKIAEIQRGISDLEDKLDGALYILQVQLSLNVQRLQVEATQAAERDREEQHQLLLQILGDKQDVRRIAEMQRAGDNAAELFMKAGQLELTRILTQAEAVRQTGDSKSQETLHRAMQGLVDLRRSAGILPPVKVLDNQVTRVGTIPIAGGIHSDVWMGTWLEGEKVALKSLRAVKNSTRTAKRFVAEVTVWAQLSHENVLPFYGIVTNLSTQLHMVSPWQENGNIFDYVKENDDAHRVSLLRGAAEGLAYLHSKSIVHGNLKCANILVSELGMACICDFAMSKIIEEVTDVSACTTLTQPGGSARWLAPELISGAVLSPTQATDVWSFAMTIFECVTALRPYSHLRRDAMVIHDIVILQRSPIRPQTGRAGRWLTDELWELMMNCWCQSPDNRPGINSVVEQLVEIEPCVPNEYDI